MITNWRITRLTPYRQQSLASWAVKTAFIFDQVHRSENVVPPTEYRRLYAEKMPHNNQIVWIAWRDNLRQPNGNVEMVRSRQENSHRVNTPSEAYAQSLHQQFARGGAVYRITFGIGHVAFMVFGTTIRGMRVDSFATHNVSQVIWPIRERVTWPPQYPIDHIGGFDNFHNAFDPEKQT